MSDPQSLLKRSFNIFWTLFRIAAVILFALWLMRFPGDVYVRILDYELSMTLGFGVALLLLILGVLWLLLGVLKFIFGFGYFWKQRRLRRHMKLANTLFDQAVLHFFAEEYPAVEQNLQRAIKYFPRRESLYHTFMAVSALNRGEKDKARELFFKLTQDPTFAFMGYFGLYHVCEESPLSLLEQAAIKTNDHPWILKHLFETYCREGHHLETLQRAEALVYKLFEKRIFDKEQRQQALGGVFWLQALYYKKHNDRDKMMELAKQSHHADPSLAGPVIMLAHNEPLPKAQKMFLKAVGKGLCPELTEGILKELPSTVETFHAFEEALQESKESEAHYLLAKLAYEAKLWGRAQQLLKTIPESSFDARHYLLSAQLEQKG